MITLIFSLKYSTLKPYKTKLLAHILQTYNIQSKPIQTYLNLLKHIETYQALISNLLDFIKKLLKPTNTY